MSAVLKLPGVTISGSVPAPPVDARLNPGSLILVDPTNPNLAWGPGIPGTVPNLAAAPAAALGLTAPTITLHNTLVQGTVERTSRGALHVIPNLAGGVSGQYVSLEMPETVRAHIATPRQLYVSAAFNVTRTNFPASPTVYPVASIRYSGAIGSIMQWVGLARTSATAAAIPGSTSADRLHYQAAGTGNERFAAVTAAAAAFVSAPSALFFHAGPWTGNMVAAAPAVLLRSIHIVDVDASGMTPAQLAAADQAAYESAMTGRWAGDTWTAPPTV